MELDQFATLNRELRQGERLLWAGRPRQGMFLRAKDWFMIPFSILWGGFAIFWESLVLTSADSPMIMRIWGIPFVILGLYLMLGRFAADAIIRKKILYGLTDERVIVLSGVFARHMHSYSVRAIPSVRLIEHHDTTGTVELLPIEPGLGRFGRRGSNPLHPSVHSSLDHIADARTVFNRIIDLQRVAPGTPA